MRKSVIIVIGFIYLASFFIIGFFGVKIQRYNQVTYVSDFEVSYQIGEGEIKKTNFFGKYKPSQPFPRLSSL